MEPRQLAMDPPPRSAALTLGRHLLGRIYKPDPRDWKLSRLMELAEPGDGTLDLTVQQVLDQTPYFTTWPNYLVFWRWVKQQKKGPKPAPTGDTTPGWDLKIQLDQGQTGHCVGFGWAGWVNATETRVTSSSVTAPGLRSTVPSARRSSDGLRRRIALVSGVSPGMCTARAPARPPGVRSLTPYGAQSTSADTRSGASRAVRTATPPPIDSPTRTTVLSPQASRRASSQSR